jgi:hypothetical protein
MTPKAKLLVALGGSAALVGTVFAAPVAEGGRKFVTALTGQAELDGGLLVADMDGTGTAHVTVNHGQGRVCWNLDNLQNLDTLVAAHIHQAPANGSGPIRINFFHFGEAVDLEDCVSVGESPFPFDRDRLRDILKNPENYYVNIHTTAFTSGAIRGQLSRGRQD